MRNFTKILCVVLALVVALSAASCSLTKQYSYKTDDVELPIGIYIYYLMNAYNEAQTYAQKTDAYNAEDETYDGSKSFLKIEITDDDGNKAVAEDWIIDQAVKDMNDAVASYNKYKALGCTVDEAAAESTRAYYKEYWDQGYSESYEPYGISFDSFFQAGYTIPSIKNAAFEAEYGVDGPSAVSDEELTAFFTEKYTSYKYFSANLYTTSTEPATDEEGNTTDESVDVPLPDEEIKAYEADFKSYADAVMSGTGFEDVVKSYQEAYEIEEDPSQSSVSVIDPDTEDEIEKAVLELKEGEAVYKIIGDDENTRQIYLLYREPIADEIDAYIKDETNRTGVLYEMKNKDFDKLLQDLAATLDIDKSSACNSYKPKMFEE